MVEKMVVIGSNSFPGSHFVNRALDSDLEVIDISRSFFKISSLSVNNPSRFLDGIKVLNIF